MSRFIYCSHSQNQENVCALLLILKRSFNIQDFTNVYQSQTPFLSIFSGRILWNLILQRTVWVMPVHNVVICLLHSFKTSSKFLKTLTFFLTHLCVLLTPWATMSTRYLYTNREEVKMTITMQYPLAKIVE